MQEAGRQEEEYIGVDASFRQLKRELGHLFAANFPTIAKFITIVLLIYAGYQNYGRFMEILERFGYVANPVAEAIDKGTALKKEELRKANITEEKQRNETSEILDEAIKGDIFADAIPPLTDEYFPTLLNAEQLDALTQTMEEGSTLLIIIGPKGIGKTFTLLNLTDVINEKLQLEEGNQFKKIFFNVDPTKSEDLVEQVYRDLRGQATMLGYPERPSGEKKEAYLKNVFSSSIGRRTIILLDVNKLTNKKLTGIDFANTVSRRARDLRAATGAHIFLTSSDSLALAEKTDEGRNLQFVYYETPRETIFNYAKTITKRRRRRKGLEGEVSISELMPLVKGDKTPMNDTEIEEAIVDAIEARTTGRTFVEALNCLVEGWQRAVDMIPFRMERHYRVITGGFAKAECKDRAELTRLLLQPGGCPMDNLTALCSKDAEEILMQYNVIVTAEQPDRRPDKASFRFHYDAGAKAMKKWLDGQG